MTPAQAVAKKLLPRALTPRPPSQEEEDITPDAFSGPRGTYRGVDRTGRTHDIPVLPQRDPMSGKYPGETEGSQPRPIREPIRPLRPRVAEPPFIPFQPETLDELAAADNHNQRYEPLLPERPDSRQALRPLREKYIEALTAQPTELPALRPDMGRGAYEYEGQINTPST